MRPLHCPFVRDILFSLTLLQEGCASSNYNSWLHEAQLSVVSEEECDPISPGEIYAGSTNIDEAPCVGDNGGPLVVSDTNVNNNGLTLAGIIHNNDCYSVETYTKVSMFRDWIDEVIGDAATCPSPP